MIKGVEQDIIKMETVNKWTFSYFDETRKDMLVTTRIIQQWALAATWKFSSPDFEFVASLYW